LSWLQENGLYESHHAAKLMKAFRTLGVGGMSSDEELPSQGHYVIERKGFVSRRLTAFLRFLDQVYEFMVKDDSSSGAKARPRAETSIKVNHLAKAVKSLPRNWYSRTWLDELEEHRLRNLHPRDDVAFDIPRRALQ
jgi:hypothetical protein